MALTTSYIIFNRDGSIRALIIGKSINQGSSNVNEFFCAIESLSIEDYSCVAEFELPDGSLVETIGSAANENVAEQDYNGYIIPIQSAVTLYAGIVKMNLKLIDINENILCTYQTKLRINPTGYEPNVTMITESQLNSLLQSLNTYQIKYAIGNLRYYPTLASANDDIQNLGTGQTVLIRDSDKLLIATKEYAEDVTLTIQVRLDFLYSVGFVKLTNLSDPLTIPQKAEVQKQTCILMYNSEIYFKVYTAAGKYIFSNVDDSIWADGDFSALNLRQRFISIDMSNYEIGISDDSQNTYKFYTVSGADEKFAKLNYDNTFRGANIFNDVVPEIGSGAEYTPSNLNQLASTGKLKEISDDLATEVSARESADALLIPLTQKGANNGVATLDNNGKIPLNQLPDAILGQVKWVGNIYIVSSTSADSYNMRECGVVQLTDYALSTLGLTGQTEITINGLTVTGTNLVTYLDLFNAIIEKYDDVRLISMFFIVSSRINHNGPVWTGYNVLTDVALSGFTSPSVQAYFTNVSTGDWIMILSISNLGSISYVKVDNSDAVISVNSKTGSVTLYGTDIKLSSEDNTTVTEKFGSIETDIAPYWNSANTYVVGDLVIYNGKLYKCIVDIPTPEGSFVPFHWQSTSVKTLLKTLPQYVDITILTTDWNNNSVSKTTGVTDLGEYDIVLCLPNGYENDAYVRAFGVELSSFVNETGVATFNCMETPTETIHITLQILRR